MEITSSGPDTIEADYIVVGAGSAGCVLAARLSEQADVKVLLLEAGGADRNPWIHVPLGVGKLFADPSVNWCYTTAPNPDIGGRQIYMPRGKVLGGSSSINGLIYIRGQREDFDHWRQLGNVGWSYDDVLPYFMRAENQERGADSFHGAHGPLAVSDIPETDVLCNAFVQSAIASGFQYNRDFNGAIQDGVGYQQATMRGGRRCSTAVAYLRPNLRRANLKVMTRALVKRLRLSGKRVVGLEFAQGDRQWSAVARKEVILCAGAINSPQIMLLSGIGPAADLAMHGIGTSHDLPGVGNSLQDHYSASIKLRSCRRVTLNEIVNSMPRKLWAGLQYLRTRSGPLTTTMGSAALFARTRSNLDSPDIKCAIAPFSSDSPQHGLHKWPGFTLMVFQLRPESRGTVKLASPHYAVPPSIQPNYLSAEVDRRTIVDGLKIARRLLANPHLGDFVEAEYMPGAGIQTDDELLDYARRTGTTVHHPASTCRMGTDATAVVDASLRVHGLTGLRVADASIMPTVASGNTNAATIMIGEKASDLIKADA